MDHRAAVADQQALKALVLCRLECLHRAGQLQDGFGLGFRARLRVVVAFVGLEDHEREQDGERGAKEIERLVVLSNLSREALVPRAAPRRPQQRDGHHGHADHDPDLRDQSHSLASSRRSRAATQPVEAGRKTRTTRKLPPTPEGVKRDEPIRQPLALSRAVAELRPLRARPRLACVGSL